MGKQHLVLRLGWCFVVQPVLRTVAWQGLPYIFRDTHNIGILHPHGSKRNILKSLGYYPEGVEGLFAENYNGVGDWHHRAYCINIHSGFGRIIKT